MHHLVSSHIINVAAAALYNNQLTSGDPKGIIFVFIVIHFSKGLTCFNKKDQTSIDATKYKVNQFVSSSSQ
jgi:hypothetical protein